MKFNKNNMQIFVLLISAFALMLTMLATLFDTSFLKYDNGFILTVATILVAMTGTIYSILVVKRINPKKYIYFSYSFDDKELALEISDILSEQLAKSSKYRFEILTSNSVPFGNNIHDTILKNIEKADIAIVLVSPAYLQSNFCQKEFNSIVIQNTMVIPIVINSFADLKKLPKDYSNIKALSLINCTSEDELKNKIDLLAKDLIRQRKD